MGCCGPKIPTPPDPAVALREGYLADLELAPFRQQIQTAAQRGEKINIGGREYDFTGLGEVDYQAKYAEAMAQTALDLQRQYGADYVRQRLEELRQADPQGYAARQKEFDLVKEALSKAEQGAPPSAQELQSSILGELRKGGELPGPLEQTILNRTRGGQVQHGVFLGAAPAAQEAGALTAAKENQKAQRQQAALQFLTTGVSPEDVQYRQEEQALGNIASFRSGETPLAQFGQLSGAGNAAAPFLRQPSQAVLNANAGRQGQEFAQDIYQTQVGYAGGNVNPWLAGLSLGAHGLGVYAALQRPQGQGINWAASAPSWASLEETPYGPG